MTAARGCLATVVTGMILVLVGGVTPVGAVSTSTTPDSRVTFGVEPASVGAAEVRSNFSFAVTPGAIVNDNVAVVNYSAAPLALQLYSTDALETTAGGFGLLPAATRPTGVGSWISLPSGSGTVEVPPETSTGPGSVIEPIVLHIPVTASPGDHAGGIVASLQTVGANRSGQRVILDQRVGTRVFVRVAGVLAPKLTVTDLNASYDGTVDPVGKGNAQVSYLLSNKGNVDLAVDQSVGVSGLVADSRSVKLPKIAVLLPGSSVSEHVVVPGLWPQVLLHATVTAQPLAVSGATPPGLVAATASTWLWAIPWTLIVIVVLLLAGYWWYRRRRRRRAIPVDAVSSVPPQPVGADA